MTATDTPARLDVPEDDWRGRVKDSQDDDLPIDESLPRRREARALLGSLLRPYRVTVALLAIVVVVENVARLSVPLLVQRGIDRGIPPILDGGSAHTLMVVVGVLAVVVLIQATDAGIDLPQGRYTFSPPTANRLARYTFEFPVKGDYGNIRSFINKSLAAVPALGLDKLHVERKNVGDTVVSADVGFVIYLRGA